MASSNAKPKQGGNAVPERIGKYVIVREVGQGSTGTVYLSHDPYYGRDVAIKVYHGDGGKGLNWELTGQLEVRDA